MNLPGTLDAILAAAAQTPVALTEIGYPYGGCGASEAGQLDFVRSAVTHAGTHGDRIAMATLVWLHDLSAQEVAGYVGYYGAQGDCFASYLGTLGLRTRERADKPAFAWLRQQ